jgi:hypothetical protein
VAWLYVEDGCMSLNVVVWATRSRKKNLLGFGLVNDIKNAQIAATVGVEYYAAVGASLRNRNLYDGIVDDNAFFIRFIGFLVSVACC